MSVLIVPSYLEADQRLEDSLRARTQYVTGGVLLGGASRIPQATQEKLRGLLTPPPKSGWIEQLQGAPSALEAAIVALLALFGAKQLAKSSDLIGAAGRGIKSRLSGKAAANGQGHQDDGDEERSQVPLEIEHEETTSEAAPRTYETTETEAMPKAHDDREVLELRVHGVNNTSPAHMLDLPADQVEEVLGDDLAGFWRPKSPGGAVGEETRGHVPQGVTREAYSWGGLARRTPGGAVSAGNKLLATLITAGWTLLLPFGLANVAYWTRRVESWSKSDRTPGDVLVRTFGLCLTAFLVVTVCDVSMDLVAAQCYTNGSLVCSRLPGLLGGLGAADPAVRLAVFSVVPVAVLLGLWVLSSISRSRYERVFVNAPGPSGSEPASGPPSTNAETRPPVLADHDLWKGDVMVTGLARVHLAAGFALVTVCLTWPGVFSSGPYCRRPQKLLSHACIDQVSGLPGGAWGYGVALVLALGVLLAAAVLTFRGPGRVHEGASKPAGYLLLVSLVVLALAEVFMVLVRPGLGVGGSLLGVDALPTILLGLMLALAASALFVRLSPLSGRLWAVLLLGTLGWMAFDGPAGTIAVVVVLVGMVVHLLVGSRAERKWQAWAGCAPGVFLGAALFAQNVLSSAVVLGMGDWLNGSNGASTLVPKAARSVTPRTCKALAGGHGACLTVPVPYVLLGTVAVLAVILIVIAAGVAYARSGSALGDDPALPDGFRRTVRNATRFARLTHRAEKLVGLLVGSTLLLTLAATMAAAAGWLNLGAGEKPSTVERSLDLTTAAVALLSVMALGALVKGTGNGTRRPLGVVWDLVSFLPRAAHPFAPPCYAERAVPELTGRVAWWLDPEGRDKPFVGSQRRRGTRVVISAHSLGGVLTVAAMMRERLRKHEGVGEIRLLTYGCQLRAFFSRIFPDLLGPTDLGTPRSRGPNYWSADPWHDEKTDHDPRQAPESEWSVRSRLSHGAGGSVLWRNLWRATDYIGFPVCSFQANDIDERADEADLSGYLLEVLTHSNYPRTREYHEALRDLADRL